MEFNHISVLLRESVEALNIKPDGVYVDCTAGGGGHSNEILSHLNENGKIYLFDRDPDAIKVLTERFKGDSRVNIIHDNYSNIKVALGALGVDSVDGIVADLGVSSFQLDTAERGFSYHLDAPLDMRMDNRQVISAKEILNEYSEAELTRIIRDYGEDKFAGRIARNIVEARAVKPLETTGDLTKIIRESIPMKFQVTGGHPAKRTFQAIRIECNKELEVLEESIDEMIGMLNPGGRLCIITFHSLEDRIVKNLFKKNEDPCTCPKEFPVCVCGKKPLGKVVSRKPILPSDEELEANSRSKSAKLRIFERI